MIDFSGPDSIIYSKSQSKLHGLRGRKNEYGYQEATGVIILKICVRKGKQRKNNLINEEPPVKIGDHLKENK